MQDRHDAAEPEAPGTADGPLKKGDLVLLTRTPKQKMDVSGSGPLRFTRKVDPRIFRVTGSVAGERLAYYLVDHQAPGRATEFGKDAVSRRRLIKLDMPELNQDPVREPCQVEVWQEEEQEWRLGTLGAVGVDGRTRIRWNDDPEDPQDVELSDCRYRWILGPSAPGGA